MLFSLLDCVILDREAVYASSEFTTGKRFYELCRKYGVRSGEELKRHLGGKYALELLEPNKQAGLVFARQVRSFGHSLVLTPNPFLAPQWSQGEYLGFWEQVIRRKCHAVYFNQDWEFSNGCTFEFWVGMKAEIPLFNHENKQLSLDSARKMIDRAIVQLEKEGFDVPRLRKTLNELSAL